MDFFIFYLGCGPIPKAAHTLVDGNQVTLGAIVKYTCTHTNDVTYSTCQTNGNWSNVPKCLYVSGIFEPQLYNRYRLVMFSFYQDLFNI